MKTYRMLFHHFHNPNHPVGQFSISGDDFREMLKWLNRNFSTLPDRDYSKVALLRDLSEGDICLTFDDFLLCQYDTMVQFWRIQA